MITWSRGLRQRFALAPTITDEEIAEKERGGEIVAVFTYEHWRQVVKVAGLVLQTLEAAELGGASAVELVLNLARTRGDPPASSGCLSAKRRGRSPAAA